MKKNILIATASFLAGILIIPIIDTISIRKGEARRKERTQRRRAVRYYGHYKK